MQPVGNGQGELQHRLLAHVGGIEDHQIAGAARTVPDQAQPPAAVFGGFRAPATSVANSTNNTSATTLRPGAEKSTGVPERDESELGGMADLRGRNAEKEISAYGGDKKAPPMAGPDKGIRAAIRSGAVCSKEWRCACAGGGTNRRRHQLRAGAGGQEHQQGQKSHSQ